MKTFVRGLLVFLLGLFFFSSLVRTLVHIEKNSAEDQIVLGPISFRREYALVAAIYTSALLLTGADYWQRRTKAQKAAPPAVK